MVYNKIDILIFNKTVIQEQQQVYTKSDMLLLDKRNGKLNIIDPII